MKAWNGASSTSDQVAVTSTNPSCESLAGAAVAGEVLERGEQRELVVGLDELAGVGHHPRGIGGEAAPVAPDGRAVRIHVQVDHRGEVHAESVLEERGRDGGRVHPGHGEIVPLAQALRGHGGREPTGGLQPGDVPALLVHPDERQGAREPSDGRGELGELRG